MADSRAMAGKVKDDPGTSPGTKTMMGTCQKDTRAILKGLSCAQSQSEHQNNNINRLRSVE